MNCAEFENRITDFLDGALPAGEASAFNEHQLGCPACRELLADVSAALGACSDDLEVEPPLQVLSRALVIPALNPPIDCDRCQDLVTEFLDGYLEPAVYHAFEDHVTACDACSDVIAGVALAVAACHSVHFSENLEVPDAVFARIFAETTGAIRPDGAPIHGLRPRVWSGLQSIFGFGLSPVAKQRFATAALIVLAGYGAIVANGGSLEPAALYRNAAQLSSRVYTRSSELAGDTREVFSEVDRIKSRVDDMFDDDAPAVEPGAPAPDAKGKQEGSLHRLPGQVRRSGAIAPGDASRA